MNELFPRGVHRWSYSYCSGADAKPQVCGCQVLLTTTVLMTIFPNTYKANIKIESYPYASKANIFILRELLIPQNNLCTSSVILGFEVLANV